jgi:hypothetical protein
MADQSLEEVYSYKSTFKQKRVTYTAGVEETKGIDEYLDSLESKQTSPKTSLRIKPTA